MTMYLSSLRASAFLVFNGHVNKILPNFIFLVELLSAHIVIAFVIFSKDAHVSVCQSHKLSICPCILNNSWRATVNICPVEVEQ